MQRTYVFIGNRYSKSVM